MKKYRSVFGINVIKCKLYLDSAELNSCLVLQKGRADHYVENTQCTSRIDKKEHLMSDFCVPARHKYSRNLIHSAQRRSHGSEHVLMVVLMVVVTV